MPGVVKNPITASSNTATPLSNYLGDYSDLPTILALPKVPGNYADYKQLGESDIQYYYDAGDNLWKPRPSDFKGYYESLAAVNDANPNPLPTWLATNDKDRSINYVVFNGQFIEEPKTLDAAYLELQLRKYIPSNPYLINILENSINSQLIIDDVTVDFALTDADFRKTFIHTGTGTINITIPANGLRNAFVCMFKVEGTGNILLVADAGVTLDTEKLLTESSGLLERRGNTQTYYTNGSFE